MKVKGNKSCDVLIIGGGPSGIIAARAAVSEGNKVILIERGGYLGGCATKSLVIPLMTFHAGKKQIVMGYANELIERIKKNGGTIGHIEDPLGVAATVTPVETEVYKYTAQEYLLEAGVEILYHTEALDVEVDEKDIQAIIVKTRSGLYRISSRYYVDATGDGEIAYLSGNEMKIGREKDGKCQPMTMMFKLSDVNIDELIDYVESNRDEFVLGDNIKSLRDTKRIAISGFFSKIKEATKNGDFTISRDRVLFFELNRRGEVAINMSRVINKIAVRDFDLSEATIEGRRQVIEIYNFLKKYIPGFKDSILVQSGDEIGVRETRRLVGEYQLTERDIFSKKIFEDTVALGSWPIDIHDPDGKELDLIEMKMGDYYGIPYRALLPKEINNLIVTGRAISTTHEAFASMRVSPICMALGQAAGTAARICVKGNKSFRELSYPELREELLRDNQVIG
ncbi:FAD-dependent oxidoreductase [Clostridium sp. AL.422]|uniref:FAD-dependent oxidoreductase n=1 Tax=Clostridium TaxID=1485 RepID=UPI00293DB19E|nr:MULTISPECIES: FAD-dependent oxidoreductase [unclassified Clostridium]MDV4151092.1 FAD-dependent oxidoreductase [Clostridium sp. AL.422]